MGWGWVRRTFFLLGNPFAFLMLDYFSVDLARLLFFFFSLFFVLPLLFLRLLLRGMFLPAEHQAVVEFVLRRVVVFSGLGVVWWVGGGWLVWNSFLFFQCFYSVRTSALLSRELLCSLFMLFCFVLARELTTGPG
jgi:hypothetical protein